MVARPTKEVVKGRPKVNEFFCYNTVRSCSASVQACVVPWTAPNITQEKVKRDAKASKPKEQPKIPKPKEEIIVDGKVNDHHYRRPNLGQDMPKPVENMLQEIVLNNLDSL